ncbi:MAG: efflux RND transporter permease subunit [Povalibacter sp.]
MRALIGFCVRHCGGVAFITLLALIVGTWGARNASLDVFPEFVPSQVDIQTEAPGFTPQQVEELVTRPVENAVNGASGLATLRSESIPGLSVVTITFLENIDLHVARQGIAERLAEIAGTLPLGVQTPKLSPLVSSTMDLLKVGLISDTVDAYALRDAAEWTIKPRLLAVPGVAHAIIFGGAVRQIQILPDIARLAEYGITLTELADAARSALALRGAGFIETATQRVLITTPTPAPNLDIIGEAVVTVRSNVPIRIRDLAEVKFGAALRSGDCLIQARPGVLFSLASQYGANTLATTKAVESVLDEIEPALRAQGIQLIRGLHRPANFIERALHDLQHSLVIAALLILAVLFAFLRDARVALIAFLAIPLSLLAAVLVLSALGQTLNTMTLGGFAVALGVLVDDAIIGIENILRRLREAATSGSVIPRLELISEAASEVRRPVIYATLVVIAVFLPELFTQSVQGRFVGPLALAFILAVLASLVVAVTVTPALCALFLRARDVRPEADWLARSKLLQTRMLGWVDRQFKTVIAGLALAFLASMMVLPFLGGTFMPEFREGHFVMQVSSSIPGISLDSMLDVGKRMSAEVLRLPYVQSAEQQVGRAELSEDTWGPHRSELHVELKPDADIDQTEAQDALRDIAAGYPGIQTEVVTFLGDRIGESLSGETAQVAIKVFGNNLDTIDRVARNISTALTHVRGIVDLQFKAQDDTPTLAISVSPADLAANGLKEEQVLDQVELAYAGTTLGQTFQGVRTVDAVMVLPDEQRAQPGELSRLLISGPLGPVPLAQVATVRLARDRYSIGHEGGQRVVTVTFNVSGRALADVVTDARAIVSRDVKLPAGVFLEFTGAAEAEAQTRNELMLYSGLAIVLIIGILFGAFDWRRHAWLVMANIPFSLLGGILAIAITGIGLSLGSVVGLVTVFGVSARNSILQLAHYEHLVNQEGAEWNRETIVRGANERLVPILMTAIVTALGLAPLAFGLNRPGQEIGGPMAVTVLGGLVSSTLLNLIVLPVLAQRFSRRPVVITAASSSQDL